MAGKGDKPRPVKKDRYDKNYDSINWKSKKKISWESELLADMSEEDIKELYKEEEK